MASQNEKSCGSGRLDGTNKMSCSKSFFIGLISIMASGRLPQKESKLDLLEAIIMAPTRPIKKVFNFFTSEEEEEDSIKKSREFLKIVFPAIN